MNVRRILERKSHPEVVHILASLSASSDPSSTDHLKEFLRIRDGDMLGKFVTPRLACLGLLQKGELGVRALLAALPDAPGASYPRSIVEALWHASEGRISDSVLLKGVELVPPLNSPLPKKTIQSARKAFAALVDQALVDENTFNTIIGFLDNQSLSSFGASGEEKRRFRSRVFDVFAKGRIRISEGLIGEFETLLNRNAPEEIYQRFLADNPVFLDPLASEVISKHRLGSEYVTDFVIRRLDSHYVLVEIEKPQDGVFTAGNDFSAKFSHALGQVLDFQEWIDSHGEYARSVLPEITSPKGLLIIGNASVFSKRQRQKLHRFNLNSSTVQVLTFDEVAHNARRLYRNIFQSASGSIA